ncbi:MAG: type II toxin-antitoxin system VapC family toxin [Candidatus Nanopelagicales bacterium]|nr:type II toxin-antitoxin system VapC family toxin [Candidatus Nanopelagicales bacterium]
MKPRYLHGLLDTSVVVELTDFISSGQLPLESDISSITLAELSVGPLVAKTPQEQSARQSVLQLVEASFDPLPFDETTARVFGRVAAQLRNSGRKTKARAFDALIASVAIQHELPLFTKNPQDFQDIQGLEVVAINGKF